MLCTTDDIKDRVGEISTKHDSLISTIAAGFSARANTYTGRTLIAPAADVTEYLTGGAHLVRLKSYPIISITSVKEAWDNDYDNGQELTTDTDYRQASGGKKGILQRIYGVWPSGFETIQVVYRAGYCAAGVTPGAGEHALPNDLREAAITQCSFYFKRRDDIGLEGVSFNGGSFNKFAALKLLPEVERVLESYQRVG